MGDTTTHKEIALQVIPLLREARPDDEMYYFELGNWMTDLSQFRDPTAMVGAKQTIFDQKTNFLTRGLGAVVMDFDGYLDDLMGTPGPQGGLLAAWFREMCLAATIEKFRKASSITPARLEALYGDLFTQYYPHEHMDFPPWPRHDIIGERKPSTWSIHQCPQPPTPGGGRKLYDYQEEQLIYISDLLTVIEQKWARQPSTPDTQDERERVLTRFGHASHAMEDFFFHSNFIEAAWDLKGGALPFTEDQSGDDDDDHEEKGPRNPHREKRRYHRRLQSPVGKGDDLSTETSEEMDQVYTGYFGAKDIYHTFMDAIKGLKKEFPEGEPLLKNIDKQEDEGKIDKEQVRKDEMKYHKDILFANGYETGLQLKLAQNKIDQRTYDAVQRACEMDRNLWKKYSKVDLGISGFVMTLLNLAKDEMEKAQSVWSKLDNQGAEIETPCPTDNGASNENIGSHSLMAKDSVRKHPLRNEAFNVASVIALYVAKRMIAREHHNKPVARSVNLPPAESDGGASNTVDVQAIDWLHVLQHFVSHPAESELVDGDAWWKGQLKKPDPDDTGHTLRYIDEGTVQQRLQEQKKVELEKKYDDLAVESEKDWRTDKAKATGTFVGQVIGAVAGAVAGAIVGAALGGVGGAILGGIIGAVAGAVLGGLIGGLIGGLF
jgi:hypothetical protein